MRQITFRGKVRDGGDWVHGWLSGPDTIHFAPANQHQWRAKSVLPETVSQFTGIEDEDGHWIYEGDMINFKYQEKSGVYFYLGEVYWGESGWLVQSLLGKKYRLDEIFGIKVIGNIYDNPKNTEL